MPNNSTALTRGQRVYAKKRKAKRAQVEEVVFDPTARHSFLTGFHKRKVQRREHAVAEAKAYERQEKLDMRRERREQLKDQFTEKLLFQKNYYSPLLPSADTDESSDSEGEDKDVEVLEGDSSVTTVTVTKEFDPATADDQGSGLEKKLTPRDMLEKLERQAQNRLEKGESDEESSAKQGKKFPKKKPQKKFRYETKAARAASNARSRASKAAKGAGATAKRRDAGAAKGGRRK
ncbi:hypothetical protein H4R20_000771 [Coemansia guatemalensis]|uniref:Nucleolar protein 12 n=1 Tax=Coemansia guatemalensis TaxID=2761395 RepID=A0A9W8I0G5_9FUNG|nr:hypothetical protein H4R20_000771 [Coemansia guatemalensis]